MKRIATIAAATVLVSAFAASAEQAKPGSPAAAPKTTAPAPVGVTPPADYVIGVGDVLIVTYWEEPQMTTDAAVVRPDGMVTLPLINDVPAAGLKPEHLRDRLAELSKQAGLNDPRVTVGVRVINSRKVFILGSVGKPGPYDLMGPMTVMQMLSTAGSLREFTSGKNITILRTENGKKRILKFNYQEVIEGKRLEQDIQLMVGDIISVPE